MTNIRKTLIAEGTRYRVFSHIAGCLIIERKFDNADMLLQGDDAFFMAEEIYDIIHHADMEFDDEIGFELQTVDEVCSWYDEMMCVPAISSADRGIASWCKLQVA